MIYEGVCGCPSWSEIRTGLQACTPTPRAAPCCAPAGGACIWLAVQAVEAGPQSVHALRRRRLRNQLDSFRGQVVPKVGCAQKKTRGAETRVCARKKRGHDAGVGAGEDGAGVRAGACATTSPAARLPTRPPDKYCADWAGGGRWPSTCRPSENKRFSTICSGAVGTGRLRWRINGAVGAAGMWK